MVTELSDAADSVDIWDLLLSEMEDTVVEGFRGHRQLPYAH